MALVACRECKKGISSRAHFCRFCGAKSRRVSFGLVLITAMAGTIVLPHLIAGGVNEHPWALAAILAVIIALWLFRIAGEKHLQKRLYQNIESIILANIGTLARKKGQTIFKDDYGNLVTKNWQRERQYFWENVVQPGLMPEWGEISFSPGYEYLIEKCIITYNTAQPAEEDIGFSAAMLPTDYEKLCCKQLEQLRWDAHVTKASGDQGSDVVAERDGIRIVLQCKLYTQPVGNKAVQEVFAAKTFENANYGAVVSNETYTASAKKIATSTGIALLHHNELVDWAESLQH